VSEQTLIVTPDGQIKFVWDDDLADLREHGQVSIRRAADVEPTADGMWMADCRRIGAGVYGPYGNRQAALNDERCVVSALLEAGLI
jgi:hypothetical protein